MPYSRNQTVSYDSDPVINERIRRAVRYGQTRWAEIWMSALAVAFGIPLALPDKLFVYRVFSIVAEVWNEQFLGWVCIIFGVIRLIALWVNGRRGRETSAIRTFGCIGGFFFWAHLSVAFWLTAPPIPTYALLTVVFALAELHASSHAASDMAAEDTFGFRRRERARRASIAG